MIARVPTPALKELVALRDNAAPYSAVNRIEPLVVAVQAVNDRLAHEKREKALLSIDAKIREVTDAMAKAQANPELCNKVLMPLQQLKTKVAGLSSIPQIMYLQDQAGDRLDEAMDAVAATVPKPSQVVRAADFSPKSYLESEAEVEAYLASLKTKLLAVLLAGKRIRIQ